VGEGKRNIEMHLKIRKVGGVALENQCLTGEAKTKGTRTRKGGRETGGGGGIRETLKIRVNLASTTGSLHTS